jgi:hypothetical protein
MFNYKNNVLSKKQEREYIYNNVLIQSGNGALLGDEGPVQSLEQLTKFSDLVVVGTFVDTKKFDKQSPSLPKNSGVEAIVKDAQARGEEGIKFDYLDYKIKVNDVIFGDEALKEFTLRVNSMIGDGLPTFHSGSKLVLFLAKSNLGHYALVHSQGSFFYVSDKNNVYPLLKTGVFEANTGMNLDNFTSNLRKIEKKKYK